MYDVLIKNGIVVSPEGSRAMDIAILGEKISAVETPGELSGAKHILDASGKFILPGLIDSHVHLNHPNKCGNIKDTFYTGTKSAAFGGDTTICDFAIQWDKEKSIAAVCDERRAVLEANSVIDFAFHACPTVSEPETVQGISELLKGSVPSVKLYMTYSRQNRMADDAILYETLKLTAEEGGIVGVHAENDSLCNFYSDQFAREHKTAPHYFPLCKSNIVEAEAVNRAVYLAKVSGGNLFIFHVSCRESIDIIRRARAEGVHVYAETCIHYLTMDMSKYDRPDGANFICSPPLRSRDDVEALWEAVGDGTICLVSSDHCGFTKENKAFGENRFANTPNGLPGMETRLFALYTYGVRTGRISMEKLVELLSTKPAEIFGMCPQKGRITKGADADLVIFDPNNERFISPDVLHSIVDWSPYDGEILVGSVEKVLLRGRTIVDGDKLKVSAGYGRYVMRSKNNMYHV